MRALAGCEKLEASIAYLGEPELLSEYVETVEAVVPKLNEYIVLMNTSPYSQIGDNLNGDFTYAKNLYHAAKRALGLKHKAARAAEPWQFQLETVRALSRTCPPPPSPSAADGVPRRRPVPPRARTPCPSRPHRCCAPLVHPPHPPPAPPLPPCNPVASQAAERLSAMLEYESGNFCDWFHDAPEMLMEKYPEHVTVFSKFAAAMRALLAVLEKMRAARERARALARQVDSLSASRRVSEAHMPAVRISASRARE